MRFAQEVHRRRPGETPDPAAYAEGMRRATDDACQAPDAEATLAVMGAIHDRAAGKKREAVEALDRALDHADDAGLGVPRMSYRYAEKTATKVFTVDVEVSYGSGILLSGNTFQLGLGLRSARRAGGLADGDAAAARHGPRGRGRGPLLRLHGGAGDGVPPPRRRRRRRRGDGAARGHGALGRRQAGLAVAAGGEAGLVGGGRARDHHPGRPARGGGGVALPRRRSVDGGARRLRRYARRRRGGGHALVVAARAARHPRARAGGGAGPALAEDPGGAAALHRRQGRAGRLRGGELRGLPPGALAAHRRRAEEAAAPAPRRQPGLGLRRAAQPRRLPRLGGEGGLRPRRLHPRRRGSARRRAGLRRCDPPLASQADRPLQPGPGELGARAGALAAPRPVDPIRPARRRARLHRGRRRARGGGRPAPRRRGHAPAARPLAQPAHGARGRRRWPRAPSAGGRSPGWSSSPRSSAGG